MKKKQIIKKSKKAMPTIIMSFVYDLLFVAITAFALLSFIKTVDSGLQLWRQRYADDLSTTLTLIEGIPENVSITYGQKHTKFLSDAPVELILDIKDGILSVSSASDPSQKTERQYVSRKDSELDIHSPLQSFTIVKTPENSKISAADTGCQVLITETKNLIETKIFFKNLKQDTGKLNELITELKSDINLEYETRLSSHSNLKNSLYNKNIVTATEDSDLIFLFNHKKAERNNIKILYSEKGNAILAKQLSCFIKKYLESRYSEEFDYTFEITSLPNNYVNLNSAIDGAIILIQFETEDKDLKLLENNYEKKQIAMRITKTIFEMSSRYTEEDLERLKNET
jgi:hypothetical protein